MRHFELLIIGAGPAGLTAALYAARDGVETALLTGDLPGGALMLTTTVENFPGFPDGISGYELMMRMMQQAEKFGANIVRENAISVDLKTHPFRVRTNSDEYSCAALIIATGASPKMLGLPSEEKFIGRGISTCATCDGFLYRGKVVCVIGGGNTAIEEALHLTAHARKVFLIHRRDQLRATKALQERAFANEKIEFIWNSVVIDILGEERVSGIKIRDVISGQDRQLSVDGVFVAIGRKPNTSLFADQIRLDDEGYIVVDELQRTNIPMVFAAGDVSDKTFRQAVTAAASGCKAAIMAVRYLAELKEAGYPPPWV
ncbi:MAG: thioredoxin-disulfide reductase [Armatimonadota bacterium]|nr:thioredoxin-disulfide reductase [Armatimonadota bacterium]MCX7778020.1 thioredoxin-disulfide reductase [Armatimonadota bacterium]MDW8026007.1 thioredoxin-disulfide reductase [Armatimonadota bacterium]